MWSGVALRAQEPAKAQKVYLPEAGDIAIGIDVTPVLDFIGNAFNGWGHSKDTKNTIASFGGTPLLELEGLDMPTVSILGKYMLTDAIALRGNIGLMVNSDRTKEYVTDDLAALQDPLSSEKLVDERHIRSTGACFSLGGEYRRGSRRVQGIFGASLLFAFQNKDISYTWANDVTEINQFPSYADFGSDESLVDRQGYRLLKKYNEGTSYYFGLVAHVGIECFIFPKVSIGGEVSLSAYETFGAKSFVKKEGFNPALNRVEKQTVLLSPGNRDFHLGTENLGAKLFMMFYF